MCKLALTSPGLLSQCVRTFRGAATYQPAFPCSELEDAVPGALPVAALQGQRVLQEPLGSDVVEEEGTLAGAHRHDVLVETHRADACTDSGQTFSTVAV